MTTNKTELQTPDTHANPPKAKTDRDYAVVLYGATSFVGQITAQYLADFLGNKDQPSGAPTIRWAIAGRDEDKLKKIQAKISDKSNAAHVDIIIANSNDEASLDAMTQQTQVIISTVGPYLKYGEPLIKACTDNGTDYVDLTGEAIFIKDMMDKYQEAAKKSGARIVNSCGFDSIPLRFGRVFHPKARRRDIWSSMQQHTYARQSSKRRLVGRYD